QDLVLQQDTAGGPFRLDDMVLTQTLVRECSLTPRDGRAVPVEISMRRLPDGTLMGIARDIRERRRVERDRVDEARLQGVLLAARTGQHALNNELTLVARYTEIL